MMRVRAALLALAACLAGCGGSDAGQDAEAQLLPALAPSSPAR